ncbi:MAG: M48 family metalloprotease, partial [Pseudomonadota bacterium]
MITIKSLFMLFVYGFKLLDRVPVFMRKLGLVVLLTLPFLAGASTKKNKQTGIYHRVEIMKDDEAEVITNSEELEELFKRRGLVYQDPKVTEWVSRIGEMVAPDSTDPYINYRFFVLRDPTPNAFALPDGQIYIHTGMLARLHNEAQLACLLGHEVVHVAGHHGILVHRSNKKKAA